MAWSSRTRTTSRRDKKTSSSFLYNATRSMYEQLGFTYQRPKGKGNCVMTLEVPKTKP